MPRPLARSGAFLPAAAFILLALVLLWPAALHPVSTLAGHPETSAGCHAWLLWWVRRDFPRFHSTLIFFPEGADVLRLYGSDLLGPLLLGFLPLPPALLYNLWAVLLLAAGGLGTWRLARREGAPPWGALLAGALFESAPFFQHELLNGTTELLAASFLPWLAHALLDLLDRPSPGRGLALGALAGLSALASAYNAFFGLVLGAVVLAERAASRWEPLLAGRWKAILLAGATALLVGAPLPWLHLRHGASALYARRSSWTRLGAALPDSFAELQDWVDPRPVQLPVLLHYPNGDTFAYWTTATVFLGFTGLLLALLALLRRRGRGPWLPLLLAGVLLGMGPVLRLGGRVLSLGGHPLPLPALGLAALFPPFSITALHAYRYAALAVLGLAVLAGRAARHPAWLGLLLAENLLLSPVPRAATPVPSGRPLEDLAREPPGAVLCVPWEADELGDLSTFLLAQTVHGHPVQDGGIHWRAEPASLALFDEVPLLSELARRGTPYLPGPRETARGLEALRARGYAYVLAREAGPELSGWLESALGEPAARGQGWAYWRLSP